MMVLPAGDTKVWDGLWSRLFSRLNFLAMASRSWGMPSTAVYLVSPRRMAAMAASLMLSGVSKSGSPAARPITSRPAALRSRAFPVMAIVGDGWMRFRDWDRKSLGRSAIESLAKKAGVPYQPWWIGARVALRIAAMIGPE